MPETLRNTIIVVRPIACPHVLCPSCPRKKVDVVIPPCYSMADRHSDEISQVFHPAVRNVLDLIRSQISTTEKVMGRVPEVRLLR